MSVSIDGDVPPDRSISTSTKVSTEAATESPHLIAPPLPLASVLNRPPLLRKGTSYASNASGHSAAAASGNCRLLWRGTLINEQGLNLYGIAIIAHLFSVPTSASKSSTSTNSIAKASPQTPSAPVPTSFSPFDDPFSSASKATSSGADLCLGLEMLRGASLKTTGTPMQIARDETNATSSPHDDVETSGSKNRSKGRGKGKGKEELETIKVETPTDIRVYIDERCPDTVEWFEDYFCREGCEGRGLTIDAGGEEIVMFASLPERQSSPPPEDIVGDAGPSTSTAQVARPALTLLIGRAVKPVARKPRPDDPLPRESLFTAKLRKTASLPASAFSKTPLFPTASLGDADVSSATKKPKPKRLSSKDKAIASLLGKAPVGDATGGIRKREASNPPPGIAFPVPLPQPSSKRPLSRSSTTSARLFSTSTVPPSRQASLPPVARGSTSDTLGPPGSRPFKRSRSSISSTSTSSKFLIVESPPQSDEEDFDSYGHRERNVQTGYREDRLGGFLERSKSRRNSLFGSREGSRGPSPTPSVASTTFLESTTIVKMEGEDEGEEVGEEMDRLAELREIGIKKQRNLSLPGGRTSAGIKRSSSLPIGTNFLGQPRNGPVVDGKEIKREEGMKEEIGAIETRNKNTVKKLAAARLEAIGVGRNHPEFRDLFAMVTRGVGFAMRDSFKSQVLSSVERLRAESLIEQHLRMYLPSHQFDTLPPTPAPTVEPVSFEKVPTTKIEENGDSENLATEPDLDKGHVTTMPTSTLHNNPTLPPQEYTALNGQIGEVDPMAIVETQLQ